MTTHSSSHATIVAEQYGLGGLRERITAALAAAGKDLDTLTPADIVPFEEFHSLGRPGTVGLLSAAGVTASDHVLDAGSGICGTSRLLAGEYGCRVTAVDLTDEFCAVAEWLNDLVGLGDRIEVLGGDVTALPLDDASVDVVVSQHVQMNIADKATLYREARRVLAPGGRLALWDVTAGPVQPIRFPVPWADVPERSHLITPDALRELLEEVGFELTVWNDLTDFTVTAMSAMFERPIEDLSLQLLVPDIIEKGRNIVVNASEDRVRLIQAVAVAR